MSDQKTLPPSKKEVETYKKFKSLIETVTELSLEASCLRHKRECPPLAGLKGPKRSARSGKQGCARKVWVWFKLVEKRKNASFPPRSQRPAAPRENTGVGCFA
jgi:hypothetical protein